MEFLFFIFFLVFPSCSHLVPNDVPHYALQVLNVFPKGVVHSISLHPISFGQRGGTSSSPIFRSLPSFSFLFFLVMGQSKWPIAFKKNYLTQKKTHVEGSP